MIKGINELNIWNFCQTHLSPKIRKKLLDQLYLHSKKSVTVLLVLSAILTYFMSSVTPSYIIYPWFFAVAGIAISRLYDAHYYLAHDYSSTYVKWRQKFAYKSIANAALWGMVPILMLQYTDDIYIFLFIVILLLGLSAGASASLAPNKHISMIYLSFLLLPLGYYVLTWGNITGVVSFFVIILYLLTLFNVTEIAGSAIIESYQKEEALTNAKNELYTKKDELNNLFQQTPIGVFYFDLELKVLDCNIALAKMLNSTPEELIGFDLTQLPDKRPFHILQTALVNGTQIYRGPYASIKGLELWIEAKASPVINNEGKLIGGIVLLENKTKEKEAADELEYMARHDELTSLNNRRSFREYMFSLLDKPKHQTHYSVLFYIDLNQFKQINDSLGHSVGDELLIQVANRLKNLVGTSYRLSRLGGDEFTIVLPFCTMEFEQAHKLSEEFGKKIQHVFREAFVIDELHLYIKSSIGIVIIEPNTTNIEELIRYADISMYQAKRQGSSRFAYYSLELDKKRKELFRLQHDLNHAISNNELQIFYQPIVSIKDNRVLACEALLRWNHPQKGRLSPSSFIDLAIESGLIDDLGWWVIKHVCMQIADWKQKGKFNFNYISININARQLVSHQFVDTFFEMLKTYDVKSSEIKVEITERSLIDNFEQTNWVIRQLQFQGVRCAIDDFGIGYSSLSYLQKLSFSVLKIDREFIKDILINQEDRFLVESIIMIAKRFNYGIVVEGIESEEQKHLIQSIDPTVSYQGYLFSPAVSAVIFEQKFL